MKVKSLKIYPQLISIYNYKNLETKKVILKDNKILLQVPEIKPFIEKFFNKKKKFIIDNLEIDIYDERQSILKLKDIYYANFGYDENLISGIIFKKKFKVKIDNNSKDINFELLKSGISANVNFNSNQKERFTSGNFKSKILNTNLKFKFDFNNKKLKVYNLYLRNKNISFSAESLIILRPFLDFNSKFDVENINLNIFKKIDIDNLLKHKNFIKQINSKNEINYNPKKFSKNYINDLNLKLDFGYGRINYLKKFSISKTFFQCKGNLNLLEEYPLIFFDCTIISANKKKFLKAFSIKTKKSGNLNLKINGNLNIKNKKINFKNIIVNDAKATKEDLRFYKDAFEKTLLKKSLNEIFSIKSIKKFILEIT